MLHRRLPLKLQLRVVEHDVNPCILLSAIKYLLTWCFKSSHDAGGKIGGKQGPLAGVISFAVEGHVAPVASSSQGKIVTIKVVIDEGVSFSVNFRRSENGGVGKLFEHGLLAQPLCLKPFRSVGSEEFLEELDVRLSYLKDSENSPRLSHQASPWRSSQICEPAYPLLPPVQFERFSLPRPRSRR